MSTRGWLSREMAMYERSGAPRRWESRTESEREGVRVAPGPGLVRDRVERVALLAMQSSPAPLPGDEVAGGTSVYVASVAAALAAVGVSCDIYTRATSPCCVTAGQACVWSAWRRGRWRHWAGRNSSHWYRRSPGTWPRSVRISAPISC